MLQCKKCKEFLYIRVGGSEPCRCEKFSIVDPYGEEHEQWACSPYTAAMKFAEYYNIASDYRLINKTEVITVDGQEFSISAKKDIHYSVKVTNPITQ